MYIWVEFNFQKKRLYYIFILCQLLIATDSSLNFLKTNKKKQFLTEMPFLSLIPNEYRKN